jgi:maltose phosphorylase
MFNKYTEVHPWKIIERRWDANNHPKSESLFSIGNGRMGQRANFEETYTGKSLQGSYIAGVYYPDKTRVGWWKNGYPEYFAKVLNSCNWIGIQVKVDGEELDLNTATEVASFYRELDMQSGLLKRSFEATLPSGKTVAVEAERLVSIVQDEIGTISYSVTPKNFSGKIELCSYLDFDVENEDSNYDEKFWEPVTQGQESGASYVHAKTKKTGFEVTVAMRNSLSLDGAPQDWGMSSDAKHMFVSECACYNVAQGQTLKLEKFAAVLSSMNHDVASLDAKAAASATAAAAQGYEALRGEHVAAWHNKWETCDIEIDGDAEAQQAIRFNIFHLNQTFTGVDDRLNIGPKGFTGEKYGGSTYWDTEAYCLPFYLATAQPEVAKNLCLYRYKQLDKAIENAGKLGFTDGAALFPMVTMNGEECHNEWEITFEEIHRNAAIAYGVFDYIRHTQDWGYLAEGGFEVLLGISRFWSQRVNWSAEKEAYVMLGVTGPNEYENNINNNWYTNRMAAWTLEWTLEAHHWLKENAADALSAITSKTALNADTEFAKWRDIIAKMYYPKSEKLGVVLQQDGFLDKEQLTADDLSLDERPINQHWSWDRILRSIFIKQADVLQGYYFLNHLYEQEEVKRNFDFYEPKTVHESSLSPCVHAILAAQIDYPEKAYEMYLRTSRLDIDDYNREVHEGLHITSMAGTWMSVVQGFGGMKIRDEELHFTPKLPAQWKGLTFSILWRGATLKANLTSEGMTIENVSGAPAKFAIDGQWFEVAAGENASTAAAAHA